jgi:hypothetical protein
MYRLSLFNSSHYRNLIHSIEVLFFFKKEPKTVALRGYTSLKHFGSLKMNQK